MKLEELQRFIRNEAGLESGEYAMLLALICMALIMAVITFARQIGTAFTTAANLFP